MICGRCGGSRLVLAGWMGPTPQRPHPDPCPDCSPSMSPREIQVAQTMWLLDNQHRDDVKQILARMAVHEARRYRKVLQLGWHVDSFPSPSTLDRGLMQDIAEADLVVDGRGRVLKDRYGAEGYKLSDTELRRIKEDCAEFEDLPF